MKDIKRNPFEGLGKPESLKNNLSGLWRRRIDKEHRVGYFVNGNSLALLKCKGHYE
ncbi:MAG: Txe/YoeB family addiction module toxin [Anaerococcus sp.]|nr:Txe/YoeB family addiction module toxin [Anaerococcus sp.]